MAQEERTQAQFVEFCQSTFINQILKQKKNRPLILLDKETPLKDALQLLNRENILSAPVVDGKTPGQPFLGFVDVLDICGFVLEKWRRNSWRLDEAYFPASSFFETPVREVLNFSEVDDCVFIDLESSLYKLIELFQFVRRGCYRVHRLAVIENKTVVNVISQSDVIAFLAQNIDQLPSSLRNSPLGIFRGLVQSPLMVRIDAPFVETLEKLHTNRVSGLALVDDQFKLCGNFSVSDLRGMNFSAFEFFTGSTLQFMAKGTAAASHHTIAVGEGNTFGEAVTMLAKEHIHRVHITTEYGYPCGLLTLTDVIVRLI